MRTIWYMGVKTRLIPGFIDEALAECAPPGATLLDIASGSASVATALASRFRVVANDVQRYGAAIARAYLLHDGTKPALVASLDPERDLGAAFRENFLALAEPLADALAWEDAFLAAHGLEPAARDEGTTLREPDAPRGRSPRLPSDPGDVARAYRSFALDRTPRFDEARDARCDGPFAGARRLFSREEVLARRRDRARAPFLLATAYYPNVYLGLRQAIAADSLRFAIDRLDGRRRDHYLAALLHAVSVTTSATSHFCQPRGLRRDAEVRAVLARRSVSLASRLESFSREIRATISAIEHRPGNAVLASDWRALFLPDGHGERAWAVPEARADVVYLDPPYTSDNYSRFYHLLEVLADYDYPRLDGSKGRYPEAPLRHQSAFCRRRTVERELSAFLDACARARAAAVVSYAEESGLLLRHWREDRGLSAPEALDRFRGLARARYGKVELGTRRVLHSGQGRLNEPATELLLVCREPKSSSTTVVSRRARRRPCAT